jgi:hypothetical protein
MRTVRSVRVSYSSGWNKWPDSQDTGYSTIEKEFSYQLGSDITVQEVIYPAYAAYAHSGILQLHPGCATPGDINNLLLPDARVIAQQLDDLKRLAETRDVICWIHSTQCFKPVADALPALFKLRILDFGDDCPGSSERKTFPVAHGFNAYLARMLTWNYETGERTQHKYAQLGLKHFYHHRGGPLDWLTVEWAKRQLSVEQKWQAILDGAAQNLVDLNFVGCIGRMNPVRYAFMTELNARAASSGLRCALHGKEMRDGLLQPSYEAGIYAAKSVVELYTRSLFGVNFPASSLFNGRLFDLPLTGVIQVLYDKNNELATYGMLPHMHYLPFDGTVEGLFRTVHEAKRDLVALSTMASRAEQKAKELISTCAREHRLTACLQDWLAGRIQ